MLDLAIDFLNNTGFALTDYRHLVMVAIGIICLYLGAARNYEPLLLIAVGIGIILGNIPFPGELGIGLHEENNVLHYLYLGVTSGLYPALIFLGLGALTDFSPLLSQPKLFLPGAMVQTGIFITFLIALGFGFAPGEAASIGVIGSAYGPTTIFLASRLTPNLIGPLAMAGYFFMALAPVLQPPVMKLLTTRRERCLSMPEPRQTTTKERIIFPVIGFLLCYFLTPASIPLLGPFFLGNFLRECGRTDSLATTLRTVVMDAATILLGMAVGAGTRGNEFLTLKTFGIFLLGATALFLTTVSGILFVKGMNLILKKKINPLLGAAGVPAIPGSARAVDRVGRQADPEGGLLTHAMACNASGLIGSVMAAGLLWQFLPGK